MTNRCKVALTAARGKRGPRRGWLLAKCPPMGTDAAVMWQEAMMIVNPWKVGMGHMMFRSPEETAFAKECEAFIKDLHSINKSNLDKDAAELRSIGVMK